MKTSLFVTRVRQEGPQREVRVCQVTGDEASKTGSSLRTNRVNMMSGGMLREEVWRRSREADDWLKGREQEGEKTTLSDVSNSHKQRPFNHSSRCTSEYLLIHTVANKLL